MDPQVSWDQLLTAFVAGDWDQIEEHASNLLAWLDRGGFPPKVLNRDNLGPDFNRALAQAGCLLALDVRRVDGETCNPRTQLEVRHAG